MSKNKNSITTLFATSLIVGGTLLIATGCQNKVDLLDDRGELPPPYLKQPIVEVETKEAQPEFQNQEDTLPIESVEEVKQDPKPEPKPTPKPEPKKDAPAQQETIIYVVQNGDVLSRIANKHNTTSAKIMELNKLQSPNKIFVGQKLKISADGKTTTTNSTTKKETTKTSGSKNTGTKSSNKELLPIPADGMYTVQNGDSISKIASKYKGVTSQGIRDVNSLANDNLKIGQKLKLVASAKTEDKAVKPSDKASEKTSQDTKGIQKPKEEVIQDDVLEFDVNENENIEYFMETFSNSREEILKLNPTIKSNADLKPGMKIKIYIK